MISASWLLPEGLSISVGIVLIVASAATSFMTAATGIGGGIALLAIMAITMPVSALIPVHGVVQIGSNGLRVLLLLQHVKWRVLGTFSIASVVGAVIGGLVAIQVPTGILEIGLAMFIFWSLWGSIPGSDGKVAVTLTGIISSFLTMFFGATGVFVATMVKSMRLGRMEHLATHSTCMVVQHAIKVLVFGLLGFAYGPYLALILAMIISGLVGTHIGLKLVRAVDDRRFHFMLSVVLAILAMRLLWSGASEFL